MNRVARMLLLVAVLTPVAAGGCAGTKPAADVGCASPPADAVTVTTALRDGKADPSPHRVDVPLESQVVLRFSTDKDAEVHVHGYDLESEVEGGQTGCVSFVADQAGLFDVEAHPDTLLVQLEVR
jgi:hypothetical protein